MVDSKGNTIASMYALPSGVVRLSAPGYGLKLFYDGSRVKLYANSSYMSKVRGLCGTYNGEYTDDYTTPQNCIVGDPTVFSESYALNQPDSFTRPRPRAVIRSMSQYDNLAASQTEDNNICVKKDVQYGNIISEQQKQRWQRVRASSTEDADSSSGSDSSSSSSDSSDSSSSSSSDDNDSDNNSKNNSKGNQIGSDGRHSRSYTNMRIQMQKQRDKICFSVQPQNECNSNSQATSTISKEVSFRCIDNNEARDLVQSVMRGRIPHKLNNFPANEKFTIDVPVSCKPRN